jgi:hypothetical protein
VYVDENGVQFRVRADDYTRVWNALIDEFNPVEPFSNDER